MEQYASDQRNETEEEDRIQQQLLNQANEIFTQWRTILGRSLQKAGVKENRSYSLALFAIAAIEGSVALCKAARSAAPLDLIWQELRQCLEQELAQET